MCACDHEILFGYQSNSAQEWHMMAPQPSNSVALPVACELHLSELASHFFVPSSLAA